MRTINQSSKVSECVSGIVDIASSSGLKEYLGVESFMWQIKDGDSVLFWEDLWLNEGTLMSIFPRLYKISNLKHIIVGAFKDLFDCYHFHGKVF